jgi:hypothetical protein
VYLVKLRVIFQLTLWVLDGMLFILFIYFSYPHENNRNNHVFHISCITIYCRFHPSCMGMTIEEAKKLENFLCSECSSDDDAKRSLNAFPVSPSVEAKVRTLASSQSLCVYVVHLLSSS